MTQAVHPTDPIDAVTHADPYPYYAGLRVGPALAFDPRLRVGVARRAEVVRALLADAAALRVRPPAEAVPAAIADTAAGEVFGQLARMNDGPAHASARLPLERALAGLDLTTVRADALRVAQRLAPASLSDSAFALPVAAVAHLLGFADDALPQVVTWTRDFVACLSPLSSAGELRAASDAAGALRERFDALVTLQPARANSLLAAVLAQAGDRHGSPAVQANLVGLLSQTCDATAGLVGNSLVALAREPGLLATARAQADALDALVQEVARHDAPVQNTRRFVAQAVEIAGVSLAPGDAVLLLLGAANRDPALNAEPDAFRLDRTDRRLLGFGHGAHACPGQALACAIAAAALEALLARGDVDLEGMRQRGWHYRRSVNARIPVFA